MDPTAEGSRAFVTAEELVVFAASRDLPPPPGVHDFGERLEAMETPARDALVQLATRVLFSRGVPAVRTEDAAPAGALETMLERVCSPSARVLVTTGDAERARVVTFSVSADVTVIQAWNELAVHALYASANEGVAAAIAAAAGLDEVGGADGHAEVTISAAARDSAAKEGREAVAALVHDAAGSAVQEGARDGLVDALAGTARGTTVVFSPHGAPAGPVASALGGVVPAATGGDAASMVSWFSPGAGGAWLVERDEGADPELRARRVGRAEIESSLGKRLEELMTALG